MSEHDPPLAVLSSAQLGQVPAREVLPDMLRDMAQNLSHYGLRTKRGALLKAATEIERLRALLDQSKRGEHICLKCGLRQDGYDAAAHAAAYSGF